MKTEISPETRIRQVADKIPGITFGYIGNFERWGDDRRLYLWVDGTYWENGNQHDIWSCSAKDLDRVSMCKALQALKHFHMGYKVAERAFKNNIAHQ